MDECFIEEIKKINNVIKTNVDLKKYNTMRVESNCKYFIEPNNFIELKKVIKVIRKYKINYFIIGNGSNIILTSKKKECIVKLKFLKNKDERIIYSNELMPTIAYEMMNKGYKGFEYLAMIPSTIGGAIIMNAGCYNHNISDIIEYIYYLDEDLSFKVIKKEDALFSYRNSIFKDTNKIVLGCKIKLLKENPNTLKRIMDECKLKRKLTQPIEYPNSGSIFKNEENIKAWKLIKEAGLKGYKYKDLAISEKHCNFIVNLGKAKGEDVVELINIVSKKVYDTHNLELKKEVIIID